MKFNPNNTKIVVAEKWRKFNYLKTTWQYKNDEEGWTILEDSVPYHVVQEFKHGYGPVKIAIAIHPAGNRGADHYNLYGHPDR